MREKGGGREKLDVRKEGCLRMVKKQCYKRGLKQELVVKNKTVEK